MKERERREKGGHMFCWECMMTFMMRTRVAYDEDKSRLDNDPSSYEFSEMSNAGGEDFY